MLVIVLLIRVYRELISKFLLAFDNAQVSWENLKKGSLPNVFGK